MTNKNKRFKINLFGYTKQYRAGFILSIILLILGVCFELILCTKSFKVPPFPYNLSLIVIYTLLLVALYKFEQESKFVKFMVSVPAAITSTILVTFLAALLGFFPQLEQTPQNPDIYYQLGVTHLTTSWLYFFGYLYFTTSLGFATIKIIDTFSMKKIGTLLSHLGLYFIILSAAAGSGDLKRFHFVLKHNQAPTNIVYGYEGNTIYKTPFYLKLNKFDIEEYPPVIVLYNHTEQEIIHQNNGHNFNTVLNGEGEFKDLKIKVKQFYKYSFPTNNSQNNYKEIDKYGAAPSAYIEVSNKKGEKIQEGWITPGSFAFYRANLRINKDYSFAMLSPQTKEYRSYLSAVLSDGDILDFILKVNKPKRIEGWTVYQTGYNKQLGRWSDYSVVEASYDPWLISVYVGILMLFAGAIYIFWLGRIRK